MITITGGEWIADLGAKACRNINNRIVVKFEKNGKSIIGKISYIPVELFYQWAKLKHGERLMKKAVYEAEEVFLRAYFESDIEKNGIRDELFNDSIAE